MAVRHASPIQGPRVSLALSEREFDRTLEDLGIAPVDGDGPYWSRLSDNWGLMWPMDIEGDGPAFIVGLSDSVPVAQIPGVLVHESVHVWQHYREYIGESAPSKEFEAYSIESIFNELMRQYSESRVGRARIKRG